MRNHSRLTVWLKHKPISPETQAKITTRVSTFGEHPAGLGKFTRTMFAQDLRRTVANKPLNGGHEMGLQNGN
jgi:hypothetical protein